MGKILTLELKTAKFEKKQRSTTLTHFMHDSDEIKAQAFKLLKDLIPVKDPIRLIALRFNYIRS